MATIWPSVFRVSHRPQFTALCLSAGLCYYAFPLINCYPKENWRILLQISSLKFTTQQSAAKSMSLEVWS